MTLDEALEAMAVIDHQNDGSEARMVLVEALHRQLLEDPESFWEYFFETLNAVQHNHYREQAARLLRSGAVNDETMFGDIPAILAWDAAAAAPQARSNDGDR